MGKDRAIELEAVVLATHGGPGEDGSLQAALDLAGVSYTGPRRRRGARHGQMVLRCSHGIGRHPTLARALLETSTTSLPFDGPYILKPRFGGHRSGLTSWPISRPRQLDSGPTRIRTGLRRRAVPFGPRGHSDRRADVSRARPLGDRTALRRTISPKSSTTATSTWVARGWCRRHVSCPRSCRSPSRRGA